MTEKVSRPRKVGPFRFSVDSPMSPMGRDLRPFTFDGERYTSVMQGILAAKAKMFGPQYARHMIMRAHLPSEQKKIAFAKITKFDPDIWRRSLPAIAYYLCMARFTQSWAMRGILFSTGGYTLEYIDRFDKLLGCCVDGHTISGENIYGKALTEARDTIALYPWSREFILAIG